MCKLSAMKNAILILILICFSFTGTAQYKYDNVLFKTVYIEDLCNEIKNNPDALLLDVRSAPEYMDTTAGFNFGRFKQAVNIDIRELDKRLAEIADRKDKPVFVYCSHSQRSRRASKMLADSGFTKVFNINSGMTGIRQLPQSDYNCLYDKLETAVKFNLVSPAELCDRITNAKRNIFLLDVRDDSAYRRISTDAAVNAYGFIKDAMHIPLPDLEKNLDKIPADKEIIIFDIYGGDAMRAAALLDRNNFKQVFVLLEGLHRMLNSDQEKLTCLKKHYTTDIPYRVVDATFLRSVKDSQSEHLFLDVRTAEEFNNRHANYWRNIGRLKDAVNMPLTTLDSQWRAIESFRTKPVLVYVFSSGAEAHEAATKLFGYGFKDVMVLQGGLFNVGWSAANLKGHAWLSRFRINAPVEE